MSERVEKLLKQLTLQEKVSLLAGAATFNTMAIERLGIPVLKLTDGPNGARGVGGFRDGVQAACFPAAIALAATWDPELVNRVGQALADEVKSKGAQVLLAPTVNIHRSPVNGRNFECYSEDPYLTSRIAVAYIQGVQSQGIGATIKHFVCNESEFERYTINSEVGERALREIYLPPFQAAVQEAKTWALMSSYNKVRGTYASENAYTLDEILREEWGFEGLVMSDWFGTHSTAAAINAGLDLEMPGPNRWRGEKLLAAVQENQVTETTIENSTRRVLELLEKTGRFEHPEEVPERSVDTPEKRALIREAASEGTVLLKNDGNILPLQEEKLSSIAVIGPNAKTARIMAGGSAELHAQYAISPFDGLVNRLGDKVKLVYELGCTNDKTVPIIDPNLLLAGSEGQNQGLLAEYFNDTNLSGKPVWQTRVQSGETLWMSQPSERVDAEHFSTRFTGRFTPVESGTYTFSLISAGRSRLFLDGQEVIDNWTDQTPDVFYFAWGSTEVTYSVALEANRAHTLVVEYATDDHKHFKAVRLGCQLIPSENALDKVIATAAEADVALVFVGLSGEWESEGFDRPNIDLVGQQVELIQRVAAANPKTIVVLNTGSPINMPWLDQVSAVLQSWYPGQECGNAIADLLFGDVTPSGKLTQTFPVRLEDNPAYINYPGENGKVTYGEGLFVGYRYYEKKDIQPLFPFGYGLSYTTFTYNNLQISKAEIQPGETLQVSIEITNSGTREGKEIAQLYIRDMESKLHRPLKELKAFAKVHLQPGETRTVAFDLDRSALAYYDDLERNWIAEAGEFEVQIGASSQDIRATTSFVLNEASRFGGHPAKDTLSAK